MVGAAEYYKATRAGQEQQWYKDKNKHNFLCGMRQERLKEKSDGVSEVLSWVSKSRKLEDRMRDEHNYIELSKVFNMDKQMTEQTLNRMDTGVIKFHGG